MKVFSFWKDLITYLCRWGEGGKRIESNPVSLTESKQNYSTHNFMHSSSPINLEYKPCGLMAQNDNV